MVELTELVASVRLTRVHISEFEFFFDFMASKNSAYEANGALSSRMQQAAVVWDIDSNILFRKNSFESNENYILSSVSSAAI